MAQMVENGLFRQVLPGGNAGSILIRGSANAVFIVIKLGRMSLLNLGL